MRATEAGHICRVGRQHRDVVEISLPLLFTKTLFQHREAQGPVQKTSRFSLLVLCTQSPFRRRRAWVSVQTRPRFLCTFFAPRPDSQRFCKSLKFKNSRYFFACSLHSITFSVSKGTNPSSATHEISLPLLFTNTPFRCRDAWSSVRSRPDFLCSFFAPGPDSRRFRKAFKFKTLEIFFACSLHSITFSVSKGTNPSSVTHEVSLPFLFA